MESFILHIRKLRVDLLLLLSLVGLMVFGATFILSAAMDQYEIEPANTYFFRQLSLRRGIDDRVVFYRQDYHRLAGCTGGVLGDYYFAHSRTDSRVGGAIRGAAPA